MKYILSLLLFLSFTFPTFAAEEMNFPQLKKEKRMQFVQMIVDAKKSCDDDRECFRKKVKEGVLKSVQKFREAKKECREISDDQEKNICTYTKYLEKNLERKMEKDGYKIQDEKVFYKGEEIIGADAESFEVFIGVNKYSEDKNNIYFEGKTMKDMAKNDFIFSEVFPNGNFSYNTKTLYLYYKENPIYKNRQEYQRLLFGCGMSEYFVQIESPGANTEDNPKTIYKIEDGTYKEVDRGERKILIQEFQKNVFKYGECPWALLLDIEKSQSPYIDIAQDHIFFKNIVYIKSHLLLDEENNQFFPDDYMSRYDFLKMVVQLRINHKYMVECDVNSIEFSDVEYDNPFSLYVCIGKKDFKINGYQDGKFHGEKYITQIEAIKIVLESPGNTCIDVLTDSNEQNWKESYEEDINTSYGVQHFEHLSIMRCFPEGIQYDEYLTKAQSACLTSQELHCG